MNKLESALKLSYYAQRVEKLFDIEELAEFLALPDLDQEGENGLTSIENLIVDGYIKRFDYKGKALYLITRKLVGEKR